MTSKCGASPPPPIFIPGEHAPAPPLEASQLIGVKNQVTETTFYTGLWLDVVIGGFIMLLFILVHRRFRMYHIRLYLPQVSVKPPPLLTAGAGPLWSFVKFWWSVLSTSDRCLLATAGLDALVLTKVTALGVKLFLPPCFFGLVLLWPLHYTANSDRNVTINKLMRHTIASMPQKSNVLWIHFVLVFVYNIYAMMLLRWQYHWYAKVRQHYLVAGNDKNIWQQRLRQDTAQAAPELNNMLNNLQMVKELAVERDSGGTDAPQMPPTDVENKAVTVPGVQQSQLPAAASRLNKSSLFTHALMQGEEKRSSALNHYSVPHGIPSNGHPMHDNVPATGANGRALGEAAEVASSSKVQDHAPCSKYMMRDQDNELKLETGFNSSWARWWEQGTFWDDDDEDELELITRKPSVRQRTTVNTFKRNAEPVAVNAAQYTVLVTDVDQPPYNLDSQEKTKEHEAPGWWRSLPSWFHRFVSEYVLLDNPEEDALLKELKMDDLCNSLRRSRSRRRPVGVDMESSSEEELRHAASDACLPASGRPVLNKPLKSNGMDTSSHCAGTESDRRKSLYSGKQVRWESGAKGDKPRGWAVIHQAVEDGSFFEMEPDVVTNTFSTLFPDEFERAIPVINHRRVDRVIQQWDQNVARLEMALAEKQHTNQDPTHRLGWMPCSGCCCCTCSTCCGPQVLSIPHYQKKVLELEKQILEAQRAAVKQDFTPSWFVFFKTQKAATIACSTTLHPENNQLFQARPAPGPENVNWEMLWLTQSQRAWRRMLSYVLMAFIIIFPISIFTSSLSVLDFFLCDTNKGTREAMWAPYCSTNSNLKWLKSLMTGWLPGILLAIYQQMVIPRLMYWCAQLHSSSYSLSGLDQRIMEIYFYWDVFNVFLQSLMGTTIISQVSRVLNCSDRLVQIILELLGNTLPAASTFFFIYIWLRGLVLLPYRLLIPHPGVICYMIRCCGKVGTMSARQRVESFAPRSIRYGIEFGILLLLFLIGLCYSVVSPLLAPVVLLYFMVAYMFWRYTVLYVYVRKYESGGVMWPRFFTRLVASLGIFTSFTAMVLLFKQAIPQGLIILATIPFCLIKFHKDIWKKYEVGVSSNPLELANKAPLASVPPTTYIPPPLQQTLAGWHPEWHKAWEGMGALSYSVS